MGWTTIQGASKADAIREATAGWKDHETGAGVELLRKCVKGNHVYALHEATQDDGTRYRFLSVALLARDPGVGGWGYKSMTEEMGPCYYACPVSYLDEADEALPPHGLGQWATKWRAEVRRRAALNARKFKAGDVVTSTRPLCFSGIYAERFRVHESRRSNVLAFDAEGNVRGLLRLPKELISA